MGEAGHWHWRASRGGGQWSGGAGHRHPERADARRTAIGENGTAVAPLLCSFERLFSNHLPMMERDAMSHREHASCIQACVQCAQECDHCADACLSEQDAKTMAECIRLDRDCAEICWMASAFMSRGSQFAVALCRLCAESCEACGAECARHEVDHCQRCAEACRHCAEECRKMAGVAV